MDPAEALRAYLASPSPDEDGEDRGTRALSPLSEAEIEAVAQRCGGALAPELRMLLAYSAGLEGGPMELVEFAGSEERLYFPPLEDRTYQIAPDGFGNAWCHWATWINDRLGPVLYYQHEGPMLLYQCDDMATFVHEYLRFMRPPYESLIDDLHEFRLRPVRSLNDGLMSRESILAAAPDLADFVAGVEGDAQFRDLRGAKPGDGIDFAGYDVIAVHPVFPAFAVRRRKRWRERLAGIFGRTAR